MSHSPFALVNFTTITPDHRSFPYDAVVIEKGHILPTFHQDDLDPSLPTIDLKEMTITPGFIDLQLNGCGGVLFNNNISEKTLNVMHETNLKFGCTTFLPTLITCSDNDIRRAIDIVRDYSRRHPERVPGIHLEGPYINVKRKGIHNSDFVRPPSPEMIDYLCKQADAISVITLAPEVCPEGTIEKLCEAGIVVAVGHSNATYQQMKEAEASGVRLATHLHNAMSPLGSREAGVVGAVFDSQQIYAGIIADGFHLTWENLRIAQRLLGERLVLVTDASTPAGTDMKTFEFANQTIFHINGRCTNADGTLAGSALTMMNAVKNSVEHGIAPETTIQMATLNAAKAIHQEKTLGLIAPGYHANLAIFDDNYQLQGSISGGHLTTVKGSSINRTVSST